MTLTEGLAMRVDGQEGRLHKHSLKLFVLNQARAFLFFLLSYLIHINKAVCESKLCCLLCNKR